MRLVPCSACQRHVFPQETACPHCGKHSPAGAIAALAVTAGLALAACERPAADVYGPAPIDPDRRTTPSATAPAAPTDSPSAAPTDSASAPGSVSPPPPTAAPTGAPTSLNTGSSQPTVTRPPAKVYGPPPRKPGQRDPF
jgi:hypothetical protein